MTFGQDGDILGEQDNRPESDGQLGGKPRYQNDMDGLSYDNWPEAWKTDLAKIKAGLRHMNGVLEVGGQGTLRDPMTLPALRTSVLCLTNLVTDLVSHLERTLPEK